MSRTITETRMLPYIFTAEEHLENSAEMARLYDQLSELEATHKQIKTSLKEEADAVLANLGRVVRFVRDKRDHRKTECRWIFDCPAIGQKTLRRNDTDADVEVRRMEDHEKQESLNLVPTTEDLPLEDGPYREGVNITLTGPDGQVAFEGTGKEFKAAVEQLKGEPKKYPDAPADFHGSLEEWHAHCDKMDKIASDAKKQPPAMPETAKAEKRTPKFGK
jgi:hypothetical protein